MKNTLFLFVLLLGLAACTPSVATTAPTATPLSTDTSTPVPSPTTNPSPSPTNESSPTPRPTETLAKIIYFDNPPTSTADFTPIATDQDEASVWQDIMTTPKLDINATPMEATQLQNDHGRMRFAVICDVGVNCIERGAISRIIPGVGAVRKILWEGVMNDDAHNVRVFYATTDQDFQSVEEYENKAYQMMADATHINQDFITQLEPNSSITDPVLVFLVNHTGSDSRTRFGQGGNLFDTIFVANPIDIH